jgi:hypothetical protein
MSINELIDKTIEAMLGEDTETITGFLGYKPDDEVLNNNQLLEEELSNAADQMPEDVLVSFYEKTQKKSKAEAERNYCLQTIEELLVEMKNCRTNLKYKDKMESIVSVLNTAITEIEELKSDIE